MNKIRTKFNNYLKALSLEFILKSIKVSVTFEFIVLSALAVNKYFFSEYSYVLGAVAGVLIAGTITKLLYFRKGHSIYSEKY